ncbi:MAG TPA: extracellular solute-binding protein [Actinoplanes sp.]|nr:extracellular solute-binding protein [Actinoplanes sp.]
MTSTGNGRFRRFGAFLSVPALGALMLTACSTAGDGGGSTAAANGFTFSFENASGGAKNPWLVLADLYTKETGVKVDAKGLPPDSYGTVVRTQLQGGNASDVMMFSPGSGNTNSVLPLAEAGYIEPLGSETAALIPKGNEALFSLDGKVYAQPTDIVPVGMVWNAGAATKAGADAPKDADAMFDTCRSAAGGGKSFIALAGSAPPNVGLMTLAISATRVYAQTPDWNQQRAAGKVTFADSAGWTDTIETIVAMNKAGCFQKGAAGGGFDAITKGITQGTSLAAFVPGAAATELANATPGLKLQVQAFPPASGAEPYLLASPNYALAINAKAEGAQKDAARAFLTWMAKPANAARFTEIQGGVAITGPDENLSPVYEPVADLLKEGDFAPLPLLEWPNPAVYDALSKGVQGLLTGQGDVPSVLAAADKAWGK